MSIELTRKVEALERELEALRDRVEALEKQISEPEKRGPGRPRKDATLHLPGNA